MLDGTGVGAGTASAGDEYDGRTAGAAWTTGADWMTTVGGATYTG